MNRTNKITIALAGNPNSGKTSIFNGLSGVRQKVGNFPGVTVEKNVGHKKYNGYDITFIDLPGTYSLTAQSLDEKVARDFILNESPDVMINVIDSGSLERSLYLTTQLIEMGIDIVLNLNMWDEVQKSGVKIDTRKLSQLLGAPVVETVGNKAKGIDELLNAAISLVEDRNREHRHPPIFYGPLLDDMILEVCKEISPGDLCPVGFSQRWLAIKLLEGDEEIRKKYLVPQLENSQRLKSLIVKCVQHIKVTTSQEPDIAIAEGRYGYIAGIINEVVKKSPVHRMQISMKIDNFLTHRILGYPIFLFFMWLIFQATYKIGNYPMGWIDSGVKYLQMIASLVLPTSMFSNLITDGIIGGVGAVIIFLPNIVILFTGFSLLEDSGYMARAAFLTDRLMHFLGLHGKSFIPMLMGFGCNVPAIMATRTLESHRDRILTTLVIPFMSCSARLPVYVLFAGAFFGAYAGYAIFLLYLLGILIAVLTAHFFQRTILKTDSTPFVMELPPYRLPTVKSIIIHVWERTRIYLKKMGGIILIASIILWFLGYFPRKSEYSQNYDRQIEQLSISGTEVADVKIAELENMKAAEDVEYSVIGRLGAIVSPVIKPLGFNWQMGVAIITGFVAKEVVVSTLGVLYQLGEDVNEKSSNLANILTSPKSNISVSAAFAFLVFILLYTPCLATVIAIRREIGTKWMWFSIFFQLTLAWSAAFIIYQGGRLLGL